MNLKLLKIFLYTSIVLSVTGLLNPVANNKVASATHAAKSDSDCAAAHGKSDAKN